MSDAGEELTLAHSRQQPAARVLHVIAGLGLGGAERMLVRLIDRSGHGHAVLSLLPGGERASDLRKLGTPLLEVSNVRSDAAIGFVRSFRPTIIQGWMPHGNWAASAIGIWRRQPVIWNVRQALYSLKYHPAPTAGLIVGGALLGRVSARRIIYNSVVAAEQHEAWGYPQRKRVLIPNGFPTDEFRPDPLLRAQGRAAIGIGDDRFLVGMIARAHIMKDHATFARAAAVIKEQFANAAFLMAGPGVSTSPVIRSALREAGIEDHVKLLDKSRDVPALLNALDVFVLSSFTEAFPNTLGEAMCCGIPCVATDVGDVRDLTGGVAKVIPVRDPVAMASAVGSFLENPVDRVRLASEGRKRMLSAFEIGGIVAKYDALYQHVHERSELL